MNGNPASILLMLSLLSTALPLFSEDRTQPKIQGPHTERMDFAAGGMIRVSDFRGYVHVEGWDRSEVEITSTKTMLYDFKRKQPDQAVKHLDDVRIVTERKSLSELSISTILPARTGVLAPLLPHKTTAGVAIEYEIHAPRDSKLVIQSGPGSVFVTGITGDIEATSTRGDILLMLPDTGTYSIDAESKLGTVVSDFEGDPHLTRYRLGERYETPNSPSSRRIRIRMGFGGITIKAVPPEASVPGKIP
jgi:hypothetical protein